MGGGGADVDVNSMYDMSTPIDNGKSCIGFVIFSRINYVFGIGWFSSFLKTNKNHSQYSNVYTFGLKFLSSFGVVEPEPLYFAGAGAVILV